MTAAVRASVEESVDSTRASALGRAIREPRKALRALWWLARGQWYKRMYPLRGIRFEAGRNLRVQGRLHVRGPGRVVFGDDVVVGDRTTPWTHHPDAVITVGDGTYLNGTRFGAVQSIRIGRQCLLADVQIMDTDFHSVRVDRHSRDAPVRVAPVVIEDNVWIAAHCGVLPGTRIGRNSVVGFGSVCSGTYPPDYVIVGNPARPQRPIRGREGLGSAAVDPSRDNAAAEHDPKGARR